MAGGYDHRPDGTEGVGGILKQLQNQVNSLRSGAGIRSAVLRGVQLVFQNEDGQTSAIFGRRVGTESVGTGEATANVIQGALFLNPSTDTRLFQASTYESSGRTFVQVGDPAAQIGAFSAFADLIYFDADSISLITGGDLQLWELPTTGSSASLRLETSSGIPRVHWVNSSRRYKTDIADAEVDLDDVLALRGRTWVDKGKVESAEPGHVRRDVGFIAEELDDLPSMRQFVDYDDDGEPQAIQYDRLTVALLALAKDQQKRLDDIETRLTALERDRHREA